MSRFNGFEKFVCNPRQSFPLLTILVPLWFIVISLVFFHLCNASFSGFLQFKGKFVDGQNTSKYRDRAPLREINGIVLAPGTDCNELQEAFLRRLTPETWVPCQWPWTINPKAFCLFRVGTTIKLYRIVQSVIIPHPTGNYRSNIKTTFAIIDNKIAFKTIVLSWGVLT